MKFCSIATVALTLCLPLSAAAQSALDRLAVRSTADFPRLPPMVQVADIGPVCGGGNIAPGVYCTTENAIFLAEGLPEAEAIYTLAHLYGHALQVRYGVADLALAAIQADRPREAELRGMVTRQVECLAGVLIARAGLGLPALGRIHSQEPFTGSHWGRRPTRAGPQVSIGLAARAEWLARGQAAADPAACSVGEMSSELIVAADQS